MRDAQIVRYADHFSTFALWWKAFLFLPLWGYLLAPLFGGLLGRMGDVPLQVGYSLILAFFMSRFIEDVLKCKIRIEKDILFFGYRNFHLAELVSVGVTYKGNQVLPKTIVLNFASGKKLSLKISRLSADDIEGILKHIEARHPTVKIDPVLRTLSKCKKLVRNTSLETDNQVEIPYHSRRIFKQLLDTFMGTAESWMRVGPLLVFVLFCPFWLNIYSNFYTMFLSNAYETAKNLALRKPLESFIEMAQGHIGAQVSSAGLAFVTVMENPFVAMALIGSLVFLVYYLARFFFRPNLIMMQQDEMKLRLRVFSASADVGRVSYESLVNAYLVKPQNSADPDKWKIVFNRTGKLSKFPLALGALSPDNRSRFLKALERLAPQCAIDSDLAEAMMPRQERSYTELWLQSLSAPAERKSLEPLSPGQLLQERFEVIRRLGVGGQGLAYLCKDTADLLDAHQQEMVLKETILPVFVEATVRQQALERFQQEAEMLEKLDCDGVVKLVDYFIEDHRGYLVLEHIDGKNLRQLVEEEGAISEERALDLALQMCDILEYLHSKGVIHRDFTPDNLILRHDGKLKLIDFNVAQQAEDGASGTIVGKHAFLPPEQFRGKPTYQSDIYAMGATLHYLTTAQDPEPISQSHPAQTNVAISEGFDKIIANCTEMQCNKRTASATLAKEQFLSLFDDNAGATISIKLTEHEGVTIAN